jgi:hypothetical protein
MQFTGKIPMENTASTRLRHMSPHCIPHPVRLGIRGTNLRNSPLCTLGSCRNSYSKCLMPAPRLIVCATRFLQIDLG